MRLAWDFYTLRYQDRLCLRLDFYACPNSGVNMDTRRRQNEFVSRPQLKIRGFLNSANQVIADQPWSLSSPAEVPVPHSAIFPQLGTLLWGGGAPVGRQSSEFMSVRGIALLCLA